MQSIFRPGLFSGHVAIVTGGGSGIGLAQTYQALQWHYGSIDFETVEGQGTTFHLRLPVAEVRAGTNGGNGRDVTPSLTIPNS